MIFPAVGQEQEGAWLSLLLLLLPDYRIQHLHKRDYYMVELKFLHLLVEDDSEGELDCTTLIAGLGYKHVFVQGRLASKVMSLSDFDTNHWTISCEVMILTDRDVV